MPSSPHTQSRRDISQPTASCTSWRRFDYGQSANSVVSLQHRPAAQMRAVRGCRASRNWPTAHNPGVNIIPSMEIFRYPEELDTHRQSTGGTQGCCDSLDRGKLPQVETPSARLLGRGFPRVCRSPDPAPPRPHSHCVGRPAFIDPSDGFVSGKATLRQQPHSRVGGGALAR
jgi:hypothetical protein